MYKAIRTGRHGFHILCFLERVYSNESGLSSWGCAGHIVDGLFETIRKSLSRFSLVNFSS